MRILFLSLLLTLGSLCSAQENVVVGYALTLEGDSLFFYGNAANSSVQVSPKLIFYKDINGKEKNIRQSKLTDVYFGQHHLIGKPISGKGNNVLQDVIMQNDRYILTTYLSTGWLFYIYDKKSMEPVESMVKSSRKMKNDLESLHNIVTKYFSECTKALDVIQNNLTSPNYKVALQGDDESMFKGILNYTCE